MTLILAARNFYGVTALFYFAEEDSGLFLHKYYTYDDKYKGVHYYSPYFCHLQYQLI